MKKFTILIKKSVYYCLLSYKTSRKYFEFNTKWVFTGIVVVLWAIMDQVKHTLDILMILPGITDALMTDCYRIFV